MQGYAVADSHIIAQDAGSLAIQGVNTGIVLYVGAVSNLHKVDIASDHRIEPHGAVVAHFYIAYYHGTFAKIAVLAKTGSRHPLKSFYYCHIQAPFQPPPLGEEIIVGGYL
jgi:hypothetical protein